MAKNRSLIARMRREKQKGKFKNWKNNPRGGAQAALKRYSMSNPTSVSKDIEMWHGQTLGARAAKAQTTVRLPVKGRMARDVHEIPTPPTHGLVFGRVINPEEGPLPKLVVMDKEKQVNKNEGWYMDLEYDRWVHEFNFIRLVDGIRHKVDVFFRGSTFVIVEIKPHIARRSVIYPNFEYAKRRWDRDQVRWAEVKTS